MSLDSRRTEDHHRDLRPGLKSMSSTGEHSLQNQEAINMSVSKEGRVMEEPNVERWITKLRRLQQDKNSLEADVIKAKAVSATLQEELACVQAEVCQLEGIHKEKEESCRLLQFQCEEAEKECARQLELNKRKKDTLEDYRCQIQEFKLKHRKQRMKFENQLHQLIDQHKHLHYVFTPERLPAEIESAENTYSQLLTAEQLKLAQLHHLEQELKSVEKPDQPGTNVTETQKQ